MEKVKYNAELFDILRDLVTISNSVIIKKENDKVIIKKTDNDVTIAYCLKAPFEYFDFPETNEDVTFYNYGEFYQYFKTFNQPDIFIDNKKITLKEKNSKIDYVLSNPESFEKKIPKEPKFDDPDISFKLSPEDHEEILKMLTLIKPKKARLVGNSEKVSIEIFNELHANKWEKVFKVENAKEGQEIDFLIFSDTFLNIPNKRSYTINIKSAGFVQVSLNHKDINLDVYTGKVRTN